MTDFKTPEAPRSVKKLRRNEEESGSPLRGSPLRTFNIPPSPCMKQLGYGTGVNVYLMDRFSPRQGCYKSPWAVKKVNRRVQVAECGKRISFEANVLKTLNHPNIIGYRSYTKSSDGFPILMMESGEKSLSQILEERQEVDLGPVEVDNILKVMKDLAAALSYLHNEKKFLHGDLKSGNVLIKGEYSVAKLCDFGVALELDEEGTAIDSLNYVGSECWCAPEALTARTVTHKTDMFSYGLVIWEMLALCAPHIDNLNFEELAPDCENTEEIEAWETKQALCDKAFHKALGTRPPLPDVEIGKEYMPVLEIFYACTEADPNLRPSAQQVVDVLTKLEEIKAEVQAIKAKVKEQVDE